MTVADLALYEENARGREGRLVREGGEWKVVTDAHILPIGRSVPETVRGYLDAYNAGDCERLLDHLSEAAWSEGGQLSREAFLEQCDAAAEARQAFLETPVDIVMMEVSGEGEQNEASAVVDLYWQGGPYSPPPSDSVTVVREELEWKLDIRESRRAEGVTTPFVTLGLFELRARFVDEIATSEGPCTDTWDDIVWENVDDAPATRRRFICDAITPEVTLYRYPNDEEARAAADRFVAEVLQEPLTTAEELVRPDGLSLAEAEAYVATLRPNRATTVPGLPDALGVLRSCNVDGCRSAKAFAVRNGVLVQVRLVRVRDSPLTIDQAAAIVQAQLERL